MIEFIGACRNFAGELAASEVTLRTFQEIQQYLDSSTRALLDALRAAGEHDRPFRKSQMDAAIKFCGKAFGQDYASLLVKAAETAEGRAQGGREAQSGAVHKALTCGELGSGQLRDPVAVLRRP